ncbi:UNVERIFIED_ORG: hypothetical protein HNP28_002784 [Comamonas terrigena]
MPDGPRGQPALAQSAVHAPCLLPRAGVAAVLVKSERLALDKSTFPCEKHLKALFIQR